MNKKYLVLTAAILSLTLIFSACGSGGTATTTSNSKSTSTEDTTATADTKSAEKVELTWYLNNQSGEDFLSYIKDFVIAKFQEQHPNITINMTLNADPTGIEKQQLAAGAGPDILRLDGPSSLQLFANAGYLRPLDEYIPKYGWDKTFQKWALDADRRNGKLYGLSASKEGLFVYYNKKMFTDNGWQVPKTYSELIDLCKKIKNKGITPFSFGCSDFRQANAWWVSEAYNMALGKDEFKKYLSGEISNWNTPELKDATQKLVDMWKNGYIYEKSASTTIDDSINMFATGKAAMRMEGSWFTSQFISKKPTIDWGMFAMPAWNDGGKPIIPMALGDADAINVYSKHPAETAEFLNWLDGKESKLESLKRSGGSYTLNDLDISSITGIDPHNIETNKLLDDASANDNIGYCSWTYWPPNTETFVWNNIEGLYFGQMTIDDFMTKLNKEFQKDKEKGSLFNFSN